MQKRYLTVLVVLMLLTAVACGSPGSEAGGDNQVEAGQDAFEQTPGVKEVAQAARGDELIDAHGVSIIYTGLDVFYGGTQDYFFTFDIVNSTDDNITVQLTDGVINGHIEEAVTMSSGSAEPGQTHDVAAITRRSVLDEHGITGPDDIERLDLRFTIYKTDSWDILYESGLIAIDP